MAVLTHKDEAGLQMILHAMALIPDEEECKAYILENFKYQMTVPYMRWLRREKAEKFQEARDAVAVQQEKMLAADLQDTAIMANRVKGMAIAATQRALEAGTVQEPSKVARDLADVEAKAIDKSRLLQDKPTQIVQKRSLEEDINTLKRLGVIEEPKQIEVETIDVDSEDHSEDERTPQTGGTGPSGS